MLLCSLRNRCGRHLYHPLWPSRQSKAGRSASSPAALHALWARRPRHARLRDDCRVGGERAGVRYSATGQLIINTGTTVVTFLMVFLVQNTQNRDARAPHLKLDELLRSVKDARNKLIDLEHCTDEEIEQGLEAPRRGTHEGGCRSDLTCLFALAFTLSSSRASNRTLASSLSLLSLDSALPR